MKRKDYYRHEAYRIILYVVVLFVLANVLPQTSEYAQVYVGIAIILAVAEIITLVADYMFFWSK